MKPSKNIPCPCNSCRTYHQCCEPLHLGKPAQNAEALMRSRYTAFAMKLTDYLLKSWHSSTRPETLDIANDPIKWIALEVKKHEVLGVDKASVEFIAKFKFNGKADKLHEISQFVQEGEDWFYVNGEQLS